MTRHSVQILGKNIGENISTTCMTVELRKFKKIHNKIIQKKLQMSMIKEYLNYLQKKDKKLLMK